MPNAAPIDDPEYGKKLYRRIISEYHMPLGDDNENAMDPMYRAEWVLNFARKHTEE